jgi:hypothetical protein
MRDDKYARKVTVEGNKKSGTLNFCHLKKIRCSSSFIVIFFDTIIIIVDG